MLADGRVVEADGELLWALRGAGAGLGVATRLDLALHAVGTDLLSGFLNFPRDRAAEVARTYRDQMAQAPAAVGGGLLLGAGLGGVCTIVFCWVGSVEDGEEAVAPLRASARRWTRSRPTRTSRSSASGMPATHPGTRAHLTSAALEELSDDCIDTVLARANLPAATLSYAFLRPLAAGWAYQCAGLWPPVPALDRGQLAWVDGSAEAVEPFTIDVPFDTERWLAVKRRCDPHGSFG